MLGNTKSVWILSISNHRTFIIKMPWELPAAGSLADLAIIISAVRFRQAGSILAGGMGGLEAAAALISPGTEEKFREAVYC